MAPRLVSGAVADVLARGVSSLGAVVRGVGRSGAKGRPGTALLRKEVEEYLAGKRPTESALEDAFLALLARYRVPEPVRQYQPGWEPRRRVDFARPEDRLLIELDGRLWHARGADRERDRGKDERAAAVGWRTVRVTWIDIHDTPSRVIEWLEVKRVA